MSPKCESITRSVMHEWVLSPMSVSSFAMLVLVFLVDVDIQLRLQEDAAHHWPRLMCHGTLYLTISSSRVSLSLCLDRLV
jgi:hypothetical protein